MEETILNAIERMPSKKFKETGFTPGVLYGDSIAKATSVKFESLALNKVLVTHGSNAKLWVKYGGNKKFGFIKEVQRHPVTGKVIHLDVQLVSQTHEVRLQLPINFKGKDHLENRNLVLQVYKSEIDVFGKAALMPDVVVIDVSKKELGDTITLNDFDLDKQLKIHDGENEIYGIITSPREAPAETEVNQQTQA
ncbi:MAG: 50S ribosomal protein L25 [Desulfitobacteriaceae bacterium]|nr:50S ribosomal protein L25 [Desulfitobacteriaceae bacterium]MDI6914092.1 50S ribosomal protein L25 [Desulfitobacteriaceae bacterium]